jgi:Leucine-rich repeat (LRR) protein
LRNNQLKHFPTGLLKYGKLNRIELTHNRIKSLKVDMKQIELEIKNNPPPVPPEEESHHDHDDPEEEEDQEEEEHTTEDYGEIVIRNSGALMEHHESKEQTLDAATGLRYVDISFNEIHEIGDEWGYVFTDLIRLDLSHNKLKSIPLSICKLNKLSSLNLTEVRIISYRK